MDATAFHDRVWAAIRDKYQSEVSGGGEVMWSLPANASQRNCLQFWHWAILASWAASAPHPQLSVPLSLPPSRLPGRGRDTDAAHGAMV